MRAPETPERGLTRRTLTATLATTLVGLNRPSLAQPAREAAADESWRTLTAAPMPLRLRPEPAGEAEVWAFDGKVPGPVIRVRNGD